MTDPLDEGVDGARMLEVGRIAKPHGLKGEVVVELVTDRLERVQPGSGLDTARGRLTVLTSRPHQHRWVVRFDRIVDRDDAEGWRGVALSAEAIEDPDQLWVHEIVGCRVVEAGGAERGNVVAVQANPASDLLVLESGALVPLRFVVSGPTGGALVIDPPDGLFDL